MERECKYFVESRMAKYIENKMSQPAKKDFEKHLFRCDYCLKVYFNLKKEISDMTDAEFESTPEELLAKGIAKLMRIKEKSVKLPDFSKIVVKLYQKGMELIEAINVKSLTPVPVTPVRGKEPLVLLKQIVVESDIKGILYKLFIDFYEQNRIRIKLNFLKTENELKNRTIKIISEDGEVLHSFTDEAIFDDLKKGIYKIKLNSTLLSSIKLI